MFMGKPLCQYLHLHHVWGRSEKTAVMCENRAGVGINADVASIISLSLAAARESRPEVCPWPLKMAQGVCEVTCR